MSKFSDGKLGEKGACIFLKRKGYEILGRNWYCRQGEIDIISREDNTLVFVEVKTRSKFSYGNPLDYIDSRKLKKLQLAIDMYLSATKSYDVVWRLDGICIIRDSGVFHFRHYRGLFE